MIPLRDASRTPVRFPAVVPAELLRSRGHGWITPFTAMFLMGAFLVTYPGDRIKVLWFFGLFTHVSYVPAFVLIGLWLVTQMLNQMGAVVEADAGGLRTPRTSAAPSSAC